ncbi:MAG: iron-containing alcohol dehydrogenase, partial [Clostridia bacterium]|nr:iron-containing alcohol dehydrogenase [Clostridia bacterium]
MFEKISENSCPCGREHKFTSKVIIENGAISRLAEVIKEFGFDNAFIIADKNTYAAAGERVVNALESGKIKYKKYVFNDDSLEPNESNVGLAVMNFDPKFDVVVGVGSGVINDIGKIVANVSGKKYIIVGTAPSMDGYASATSSMTMQGLKISLNSKCADVIIGDIDVLKNAPVKMMISGLGDMIAKYTAICEWRISNLINGEYYCADIAQL